MTLDLHPTVLAVCRLAPDEPVPGWVHGSSSPLVSVTRTTAELSIVTAADGVPSDVRAERGWRALSVHGPLEFSLTGILASLAQPLAAAGVPIFVVSTFDTDWLLVPGDRLDDALGALRGQGHVVR